MGIKKIAVFGSTGAQGSPVVRELLNRGVKVRAIARSAEKVHQLFGGKAEAVSADFSDTDSIRSALRDVDGAFFHLPLLANADERTRHLTNVIEAALDVSLPKLVFTTSGFTDPRLAASHMVAGNIAAESSILSSGIPSVVLKPTVYLENLLQPHALDEIVNRGTLTYPIRPASRKISWTGLDDQAKIVVAALQKDDLAGTSFHIASPGPLSGVELAAALSAAAGRQVEYIPQAPSEFAIGLSFVFGDEIANAVSEMYEVAENQDDWGVVDINPVTDALNVDLKTTSDWISEQNWVQAAQSAKTLAA